MDEEQELAMGMMRKAVDGLIEHFDGVLVLGSGTDGKGCTVYAREQRGNMHAVEGAVREWLRRQEGYELGYHGEEGRVDSERMRKRIEEG